MKDNNIRKFIIVPLLLLVVLVIGTTYALFTKTVDTDKVISIKTGTKYIGIYGPDKENMGLDVTYTFTIENRGRENASYQVTIEDIVNTVGRENINYTYTNGTTTKTGKLSDGIIEEENLGVGEKVTVTIRLTSDLSGDYKGKIKVTTGEPIDKNIYCTNGAKSEPNPPELVGDMIPVVYNEENKYWEKADINGKWYDYSNQMWANAVTINDQTKRAEYVAASAGTEIPIEDMNMMMVWIPRYSYTLRNTYGYQIEGANTPSKETPGAFDIKFVDRSTIDLCSGQSEGDKAKNYYTPSSFCWGNSCDKEDKRKDSGNIELSGIWVHKFEADLVSLDVISVPNRKRVSLSTSVYSYYRAGKELTGEKGITNYGFAGNYDAHMIKNTEWGAMAYLSQSKYGKYGNNDFAGTNKEVYDNNNSKFVTGCSSGTTNSTSSSICLYSYDSGLEGRGASTTGTIYGIYDTSGGGDEYVMGNRDRTSDSSDIRFNEIEYKYFNLYDNSNVSQRGIKGDATFETKGFYNDNDIFIWDATDHNANWYIRGGSFEQKYKSGIFSVDRCNGDNSYSDGKFASRLVISPL